MAQRQSPSSRKSKAKSAKTKSKPMTRKVAAKTKAKPKRKAAAKAKAKTIPKAAKSTARRTARAVQGRRPQRKAGGRPSGFDKPGKVGVETRPEDMDVRRRDPGFVSQEEPRSSADESFAPGNYEPGNAGEAKANPRRRRTSTRGGSETEGMPPPGPRAATDGALEAAPSRDRPESD